MNLYTGTRKYLRLKCVHSVFTQASFFSISFKLIIFEYVFKNIAFECILQVMYIIQNLGEWLILIVYMYMVVEYISLDKHYIHGMLWIY